jgi:hypothetical protein
MWEHAEEAFAGLFATFMEADFFTASRVYGALSGLPLKITVLQEATRASFRKRNVDAEHQESWGRLVTHYQAAANRRNEIAHGQVVNVRGHGRFLMPRDNNPRKTHPDEPTDGRNPDQLGKYRYTSADLKLLEGKFSELWSWAETYWLAYEARYIRGRQG